MTDPAIQSMIDLQKQSLAAGRAASRISGTRNSYRRDNPVEYTNVMAYLDGGPRPTGTLTKMGEHLVLEEDVRIALVKYQPTATPPPPGILAPDFSGDWHAATGTGLLTQPQAADYTFILDGTPDTRMQIVTTPKRRTAATFSVKVTVAPGGDRAENSATHVLYTPGMEFWAAWSIYLDPTWTPPVGFALFHQFFGETGGQSTGSPPFALEITTSSNFELRVRGGAKANAGASAPKDVGHTIAAVSTGVWHDFLAHIRLAKDSSGLIELYHRIQGDNWPGTPSATDTGINVLTVAGIDQNVYPESGYYRSADPNQIILYTAGMWVRSSRSEAEVFFN